MEEQVRVRKKSKMPIIIALLGIVSVVAVAASVIFYMLYAGGQAEANKQKEIFDKVAKIIELPDEKPTIVTVADKEKLTNRQLASQVNNGDVLLVFAQAKRLVIYRPSSEKVANVLSFENTADAAKQVETKPNKQ